jgi:TRAP-type transport system periplasmic protein
MAKLRKLALLGALLALGLASSEVSAQGADIQNRLLRLSTANPAEHPQTVGAQRFADIVKERSGGKINVRVFHSSQLGSDYTAQTALQSGTLDMMTGTTNSLMGIVPEMGAIDLPYVFQNFDEVDAILAGPVGQTLFSKLPEKGMVPLGWMEQGFRVFHTTKKLIKTVDDFKGLKLRVQPTAVSVAVVNALGANAVPMPFQETYTALEQGAIDGMDNPLPNIVISKFYELNKNISITNHMYQPVWLGISKITWNKLSDAEKKILNDAGREASDFQRKLARDYTAKVIDQLKAQGCTVYEIPPADIAAMRATQKDVVAKFSQAIEPAATLLNQELAKYRSRK